MKKVAMLIAVAALFIFVASGYAQVNPGSFSVTPFFGGYTFEGNEGIKRPSAVYGLRAGYNFTKNLGVEGFFNYIPATLKDVSGDTDLKIYGYGVEALYHFIPEKRLVPFLAVGAGGTRYCPPDGLEDRNKFTLDYGAGLKFFLTDWLALRADVRHVIPFNDTNNNLLYTIGINFAFGGTKKTEVVQTVHEQPVEQAAPEQAPQAEPEIKEKGRITLNVQFDTGKANIKKTTDRDDIDKLVEVMKKHPELNVVIEGHTDNVGSAAGNKDLSQKRADAVKAYMVKSGIDSERMTAKGYGMEKPVASNATEEGRAKNRRVEAAVDYEIKK